LRISKEGKTAEKDKATDAWLGLHIVSPVLVLSLLGKWTLLLLHLLCRGNKMVMKKKHRKGKICFVCSSLFLPCWKIHLSNLATFIVLMM
jgi:hypothetical protein